MKPLFFEILADPPTRKKFINAVERLRIGSIDSCDIFIDHPNIENVHALIEVNAEEKSVRLIDVSGSDAGVIVNGQKIQDHTLKASDRIQLGPLQCVIYFEGDRPQGLPLIDIPKPPPPKTKQVSPPPAEKPEEEVVSTQVEKTTVTLSTPIPRTTDQGELLEITYIEGRHVLDVSLYKPGQKVTVGPSLKSHYFLPLTQLSEKQKVCFVEPSSKGMTVHLDVDQMRGTFRIQGKVYTIEAAQKHNLIKSGGRLGHTIMLSSSDYCKLSVGRTAFFIAMVPRPEALKQAAFFDLDPVYKRVVGLVCVLWLALFFAVPLIPVDAGVNVKESAEKVFQKVLVKPKKPAEPPPKVVKRFNLQPKPVEPSTPKKVTKPSKPTKTVTQQKPRRRGSGDEGVGKRRAGKEGRRGRLQAKSKTGVRVHRQSKRKIVSPYQQGLLGAVTTSDVSARLSTLVSKGGQYDKTLKGIGGTELVEGRGSEGEGFRGTGLGGGGESIHISGLGTEGRGAGTKGRGTGTILGKGAANVLSPGEDTVVEGQLSKEEIRKVVQAHLGELRGCYQFYLNQYPKLSGNVVLSWIILESGKVYKKTKVVASSWRYNKGNIVLNRLLNCMASKIATWQFPQPKGGIVIVKAYPFNFFYE